MSALHEALSRAIADCGEGIKKEKQAQGYKFRGIDQVLNFLNPILARHQLALVPHNISDEQVIDRQTKSGGAMYFARAKVEFRLYHACGESLQVMAWAEASDVSDKALNKVMSVAFKYAAIQTFCIPLEDVADENPTSEPMAPNPPTSNRKPEASPPSDGYSTPPAAVEFLLGELTGTLVSEAGPGTISRYLLAVREHIKRNPEWPRDERERWIAHGVLCSKALETATAREKAEAKPDPQETPDDDLPY